MYEDHLYKDLTYKIIGLAMDIHKILGPVHKEIVYHKALQSEFKINSIPYSSEKVLPVIYKGVNVGVYKPDFIVDEKVVVEIKATEFLSQVSETQLTCTAPL